MNEENQKNKQRQYMLEKVKCPCGTITARCNMTSHRKTNKHQRWVEQNGGSLSDEEYKKMKDIIENYKKILTNRKKY